MLIGFCNKDPPVVSKKLLQDSAGSYISFLPSC